MLKLAPTRRLVRATWPTHKTCPKTLFVIASRRNAERYATGSMSGGRKRVYLTWAVGSGTWTEFFAQRFGSVIGIEQSPAMLAAAKAKLTDRSNVELLNQDLREPLPPGPFDLVFLGGICMYLSDADTIALVSSSFRTPR